MKKNLFTARQDNDSRFSHFRLKIKIKSESIDYEVMPDKHSHILV